MLCSSPLDALAIFAFAWMVGAQSPTPLVTQNGLTVVPLFEPPITQEEPPPKPLRVSLPRKLPTVRQPKIEVPKVVAAREKPLAVPEPKLAVPKPPAASPGPVPTAPQPKLAVVHPPAFSTGSSAKPTVKLPAYKVQTGGFGNPQGLPGHAEGGSKGNVPQLGSFDLPSGPGHGNGSGGAKGVPGVVASAGFGNGVAVPPSAGRGEGTVQSSGFGDAVADNAGRKAETQQESPDFVPAAIISKPAPVYPQEARKLHIEGEVLLSVIFEASGQVRVLHVVSGLGHGMDEAAERAAEGIRFKPARRHGQPVDTQAVVHIIFQLAY